MEEALPQGETAPTGVLHEKFLFLFSLNAVVKHSIACPYILKSVATEIFA